VLQNYTRIRVIGLWEELQTHKTKGVNMA